MNIPTLVCVAALGGVFCLGAATAGAEILVSDGFRLGRDGRAVGDPLSGSKTESGDAVWSSVVGSVPIVFTETGGGAVRMDPKGVDKSTFAFLPLSSSSQLQVEADVNAGNSPDTNWAALGFAASSTQGLWGSGTLWINLRPWGDYEIYAQGIATCVSKGSAPRFANNGFNRLRLSYDGSSNTVSAWINGVNVLNAASLGDYVPNNKFAGIGFLKTSSAVIDDLMIQGR